MQRNGAGALLFFYQKIQVLRNNTDKNYFAIIVIKKSYVYTTYFFVKVSPAPNKRCIILQYSFLTPINSFIQKIIIQFLFIALFSCIGGLFGFRKADGGPEKVVWWSRLENY